MFDENKLVWKQTPYGFYESQLFQYGISMSENKKRITVLIDGDEVVVKTVSEAIELIVSEVYKFLQLGLAQLNKKYDGQFDFELIIEQKQFYILDHNENFYYDRVYFDKCFEDVKTLVKEVLGDDYSIECEIPGRWIIFN